MIGHTGIHRTVTQGIHRTFTRGTSYDWSHTISHTIGHMIGHMIGHTIGHMIGHRELVLPKLRVRQSALPVRSFGFMRIINSSVCGCVCGRGVK
ncbi:hypothetical protein T492DRAFT_47121 [Pavlovales sp. CCMP2436]|nr:hypothetical protein T492DRAFT_47121 [Pavlovales sp. CCMP2436]